LKTGSCLCGAVRYEVTGPLRPVIVCHCTQCRKQTGSFMHATAAGNADLSIVENRGLKWYRTSATASRGFCAECGSVLFWKADGAEHTTFTAGSLDGETGLAIDGHIFCDDAGDYYEIAGGNYRSRQWEPAPS
jgi:hypothetical protein